MHWNEFFRDGGWGMYPTLIFSTLMLGAAVVHAVRPRPRALRVLVAMAVATGASGFLGFSVGVITTFRYTAETPAGEHSKFAMLGIAESANNVVLALIAIVLAALVTALGSVRANGNAQRAAQASQPS